MCKLTPDHTPAHTTHRYIYTCIRAHCIFIFGIIFAYMCKLVPDHTIAHTTARKTPCFLWLHYVAVCCSVLQCLTLFLTHTHTPAHITAKTPLRFPREFSKKSPPKPLALLVDNTLQHTATHCNTLQHTATHCNNTSTLQRTERRCHTLKRTETHCNALQCTAMHCNALQHTAAHCNTLQHAATRCNMPQRSTCYQNLQPPTQLVALHYTV